jgi:diketogulonate reductase-like aldo/keto reductase
MEEATALPGGDEIVTDQVLYNMRHRGIEWDLLPWCRERGIPIMAYSPIEHSPREQQGMLDHPRLRLVAARHHATQAQIALAWLLQQEDITWRRRSLTVRSLGWPPTALCQICLQMISFLIWAMPKSAIE